jgi:predicted solute-binding protein
MVFVEDAAGAGLKALECLAGLFTRQLDPLRLLEREQELIFTVNRYREENEQLSSAYEKLQQKMERLNTYYSSRRYRLADAAIGGAKQFFDRSPLRKKNRPPGS